MVRLDGRDLDAQAGPSRAAGVQGSAGGAGRQRAARAGVGAGRARERPRGETALLLGPC